MTSRRSPARDRRRAACASLRPSFQLQVLRNQSCGSTCSRRALRAAVVHGDRASARRRARPSRTRRTRRSSGRRRTTPVSSSSNSGRAVPRRRFSSTRSRVRELALRILVEHLQVRVRRRRVEVVVELLHVLAVVALAVGEPEQPLLEDRVAAVPERERQAEALLVVGEAARCRLRPSDRRGCARDRAGSSPRRCRAGCSPRAPCPTAARSSRGPSPSNPAPSANSFRRCASAPACARRSPRF